MSGLTPLTSTPFPVLDDQANIETTVKPAVEKLETFTVTRFATPSTRNAAFALSAPTLGQICFVTSLRQFLIWNGTTWEEFGSFTDLREYLYLKRTAQPRNSSTTLFANITEMGAPVTGPAGYRVQGMFIYCASQASDIKFNFTFPGADSRLTMNFQGIGGANGTAPPGNFDKGCHDVLANRLSGNISQDLGGFGAANTSDQLSCMFDGFLTITETVSGTLQPQFAHRVGNSDTCSIMAASYMTVRKVNPV